MLIYIKKHPQIAIYGKQCPFKMVIFLDSVCNLLPHFHLENLQWQEDPSSVFLLLYFVCKP